VKYSKAVKLFDLAQDKYYNTSVPMTHEEENIISRIKLHRAQHFDELLRLLKLASKSHTCCVGGAANELIAKCEEVEGL